MVLYQVALARALWRRARQGSSIGVGALLSWLGFHLLSLVHYVPYHTGVYLSFGLVWGLGIARPPVRTSLQSSRGPQQLR
jgi:hypothetical protein